MDDNQKEYDIYNINFDMAMADDDLFDKRLREWCPTAKLETSAFSKSEVLSSRSQAGPSLFTSA